MQKKIIRYILFLLFSFCYVAEGQIIIEGNAAVCSGNPTTLSVAPAPATPGNCTSSVNMSNGSTTVTCGSTICFYDSGGSGSSYSTNEGLVRTFHSNTNGPVCITFLSVDVENNYDGIYLYDGTSTSSPLLNSGNLYNGLAGQTFTANSGNLTVEFTSDGSVSYDGWSAKVYCGNSLNLNGTPGPCTTSVNMSNGSTIVNCGNSVCFYDSGGSGGSYGNSETLTRTFTSNNNSPVSITFSSVDVENNYDEIYLYNGTSTSGTLLNSGNLYNGLAGMTFTANSGSLTVYFTSDVSVYNTGWSAMVFCEGANTDNSYTWSTGATTPTITVSPSTTTTYSVTVSGPDIGTLTASLTVEVVDCGASGCPSVSPAELGTGISDIVIGCDVSSITLAANAVATAATANDYTMMSIPYAPPYSFTDGNRIFTDVIDDIWNVALNLPFAFCFYGNTYTQVVAGSNSVASFNTDLAGTYCEWDMDGLTIPSSSLFPNAIYACYRDIDPDISDYVASTGDGGIFEGVLGEYPCRSYKLSFNNIKLYDCSSVRTFSSMIVLYEGTNIIDIYLRDAPTCTSWHSGNGIIGIQNGSGSMGISPPDRNGGGWTTQNEAWRFVPVGEPVYTITWYEGNGINGPVLGTGDVITVSPSGSTDYTARLQYTACNGDNFDITNTCHVTVNGAVPPLTVTATPDYLCANSSTTLTATTTDATSYLWSTGATTASTTVTPTDEITVYTVTVGYGNGCSSVGSVTVTVEPSMVAGTLSSDQVVCSGGTPQPLSVTGSSGGANCYFVWQQSTDGGATFTNIAGAGNGNSYSPGSLSQNTCYRAAFTSDNCGVVYTNTVCITLGEIVRTEIEDVVCYGVPYVGNGFNIPAASLATPGLHTDSAMLQTADGCDSTVVLTLTVLPPVTATDEQTIVENNLPYVWNGVTFTGEGTQTAVLVGPDGCDSTVTMILHVIPNVMAEIDTTVCANALPMQWQGLTFTEAGTQSVVYTAVLGNDSTVYFTVNVIPPVFVTVRDGVCQNEPYSGYGFTVTADETATAGVMEMSQLYFTALGCDSTVTLQLTVYPNYNHHFDVVACDSMLWNGQVYWQSGSYTQNLVSSHGCDSTVTKDVQVVNTSLELLNHTDDFCEDYEANLEVVTELEHIRWSTGEENVHSIVAHHAGAYVVTANTAHCEAFARLVIPSCAFYIYVPNAITPSLPDGNNDYFCLPEGVLSQVETFEIRIFDRWGRLVFQSDNPHFRWDGREKGKLMINTTYAYYIKMSFFGGGDYMHSGVITVL